MSDDVAEVVDEFVDALNVDRLEEEADRLGLSVQGLLIRINSEALARLTGS